GPPAAGKGSLCSKLALDFGFHHLSVGDLLRSLARDHPRSLKPHVIEAIEQNQLVDVHELAGILRSAIRDLEMQGKTRLLVDGIPRSLPQAAVLEEAIGAPDLVIFFNCPKRIARARFLTRELPGRDGSAGGFEARSAQYAGENPRIVQHYRGRGLLLEVSCLMTRGALRSLLC
ncbi:P-loop containing nucleoside triphosphate hydrolase protein, partial [Aspergillus ellipticus CBS 707.79]